MLISMITNKIVAVIFDAAKPCGILFGKIPDTCKIIPTKPIIELPEGKRIYRSIRFKITKTKKTN